MILIIHMLEQLIVCESIGRIFLNNTRRDEDETRISSTDSWLNSLNPWLLYSQVTTQKSQNPYI
jgi:hypothetical protein